MHQLHSFLGGAWITGEGPGSQLFNPTTEQPVAQTSTVGLDFGAALTYARDVGGPALQALTFAERGALLAAMSKAIHAQREALIEIGQINAGNTRGDAKFDIDGATGTLMYYAGLGKTLGDRTVLLDGEDVQLTRDPRMRGRHVRVSRPGAAVLINAFNFPAWGLAEKMACAILAGMPVVGKPATATAWMTEAMVRAVVDAEILPAGVLSLISGRAGDLLDHVQWGDVIAFTGGAETGAHIRQHPQVLASGATVNIEADSLNAMVLLPDADEATYDAFIRDAHREITQKAGQKCTATRRILVPNEQIDEVIEDLGAMLERLKVGDPSDAAFRMGPLASKTQHRSAQEGLATLQAHASVVWGDPEGGAQINGGTGWFVTPVLFKAHDPHTDSPLHNVEVFGPFSTLMGYDAINQIAPIVRLGQGSLVGSLYGDDRTAITTLISQLAGWHGRLVITDAKIAEKAMGPGVVMPQLQHGGPGRAGGGQELGGLAGLSLYTQRCAIQGNGPLLDRLLGT